MTDQNNIQVNGWLPYGSNDPSVLVKEPFTSRLTGPPGTGLWDGLWVGISTAWATSAGAATEAQFPTHDPVLGVKMTASDGSGGATGYRFRNASSLLSSLDIEGQLSLEVERDYIETYDATYAPNAYIPTGTEECAISSTVTSGSSGFQWITKLNNVGASIFKASDTATGQINYDNFNATGTSDGRPHIFKHGKSRFITINIAWKGRFAIVAVDGIITGYGIDTTDMVDRFLNIYFGSDRGLVGEHVSNHWLRNLQISNRYPVFSVNQPRQHIFVLSDSMFDDTDFNTAKDGGDVNPRRRIDRSFQQKGLRATITISENGNYRVDQSDTENLQDLIVSGVIYNDTTNDITNKVEVARLDRDITDFIIHGGTNDAGAVITKSAFDSAYKDLVNQVMGEGGNSATSVQRLICITPPSRIIVGDTQQVEDSVIDYRDVINALPTWWDETYASRAGALKVVDIHTIFGGPNPIFPDLLKGQPAVLDNGEVHYAPHGNQILGDEIAATIWGSWP